MQNDFNDLLQPGSEFMETLAGYAGQPMKKDFGNLLYYFARNADNNDFEDTFSKEEWKRLTWHLKMLHDAIPG